MKDAASSAPSSAEAEKLRRLMDSQEQHNKWFTPDNVVRSVKAIGNMLEKDKLEKWLEPYAMPDKTVTNKTIAVIMAGNIPLVGFHDFLCVLITGHRLLAKTSTKDSELIRNVTDILCTINSDFKQQIKFTDKITGNYDAVIATGSNNTSRYFEYYFGNKPHIFRKNRNSVAIINRNTTLEEIKKLGTDVFSYFGLGCRNVSKIYIEDGINPEKIVTEWANWSYILNHSPYANNYLYNKSLFKLNKQPFLDTGFLLFTRDAGFTSPVSVIFYDFFASRNKLKDELSEHAGDIQCIVSENDIPFGQTQYPEPGDYADNIDTIEFLISLK
ncbi:MAG: acyl-CoA reductase [Bacteroidota bacterium]|nr:acyl-CoA reductase [Bacteroidota bacterium]